LKNNFSFDGIGSLFHQIHIPFLEQRLATNLGLFDLFVVFFLSLVLPICISYIVEQQRQNEKKKLQSFPL